MQKHTKTYFDYYNIDYDPVSGWHEFIACEVCGGTSADIHHILFRSQGGKDNIENLIALCRHHHDVAHGKVKGETLTRDYLTQIHKLYL